MAVITVDGPIDGAELGPTLHHEHIFIDTSADYRPPPPEMARLMAEMGVDMEAPISLTSLGFLRREPQWSVANQRLDSYDDAVAELGWARRAGIRSIIDPTPIMAGRRPADLQRAARQLGMHIITGTGYYREAFQPAGVADLSIDQLAERFLQEVTVGIDGTDVRAGVIGELGTSGDSIRPVEERVLVAAARVQRATNVPVMVHTEGRREVVLAAIGTLTAHGADPTRIHICHVNGAPWWRDVVETGATIGHDCFGSTFSIDSETKMNPTDAARIEDVRRIFDAGRGESVLISNDICMKMRLHRYGGWGYDHLQTNLTPFLRQAGFTDQELEVLFVDNPRRLVDTAR
ncbi:MAG: phosphotriesterase [Candidatus Limnocylindrales bacterium]